MNETTEAIVSINEDELTEMEEVVTPSPQGDTACCFKN